MDVARASVGVDLHNPNLEVHSISTHSLSLSYPHTYDLPHEAGPTHGRAAQGPDLRFLLRLVSRGGGLLPGDGRGAPPEGQDQVHGQREGVRGEVVTLSALKGYILGVRREVEMCFEVRPNEKHDRVHCQGGKARTLSYIHTHTLFQVVEVGFMTPEKKTVDVLRAGEVGYLSAAIKAVEDARVGDTITLARGGATEALPG